MGPELAFKTECHSPSTKEHFPRSKLSVPYCTKNHFAISVKFFSHCLRFLLPLQSPLPYLVCLPNSLPSLHNPPQTNLGSTAPLTSIAPNLLHRLNLSSLQAMKGVSKSAIHHLQTHVILPQLFLPWPFWPISPLPIFILRSTVLAQAFFAISWHAMGVNSPHNTALSTLLLSWRWATYWLTWSLDSLPYRYKESHAHQSSTDIYAITSPFWYPTLLCLFRTQAHECPPSMMVSCLSVPPLSNLVVALHIMALSASYHPNTNIFLFDRLILRVSRRH